MPAKPPRIERLLSCDATELVERLMERMSQKEIAADSGVDPAKVCRLANGKSVISEKGWRELAKLALAKRVV